MKNLINKLPITLIFCFLIASSCFARVTNINSGATHSIIQDAVNAADSGDTLLVSTGEYVNLSVSGKNLHIYGGYSLDFSTQISYTDTVLTYYSVPGRFTYTTSTVENLTFTGGGHGLKIYNDSVVTARYCIVKNILSHNSGAGISLDKSTLVLEHSDIENNSATNNSGCGGGASISDGASLIVSQFSKIKNNSAKKNGGGVYVRDTNSFLEVKSNSSISGNSADEDGGGVYLFDGSLYVHDSGKIGMAFGPPNSAVNKGGGIYARSKCKIIFDDEARLLNNSAENNGGGAYLYNSEIAFNNNAKIGSDFNGAINYAATNGGGIYAYASTLAFTNADIYSCRTDGSAAAIYAHDSDVIFQNCNIGKTNDTFTNISQNNCGAINITGGSLFIADSDFVNNQAGMSVGAVAIDDTISTITNSVFRNNKTDSGIGAFYGGTGNAIAEIIDCSFFTNFAVTIGGAIFWVSDSNLTIRSSKIIGNEAEDGAGIYLPGYGKGQVWLEDVEMLYNKARNNGGAIYISNANIIVEGNVAGGTTSDSFPPTMFEGNVASNTGLGGAVYITSNATAEFYNVGFVSNSAYRGGAICANSDSKIKLVNSLIVQNKANVALNSGGGIRLFNAVANMNFCTVANNSRSGIELLGVNAELIMTNSIVYLHAGVNITTNITQTVVYSDIDGGYPGVGNIDSSPLFVDVSILNYQLRFNSPCKNSADNIGITNDCIGIARPQLGGYDMGCYEYIPEPSLFLIFNFLFLICRRLAGKEIISNENPRLSRHISAGGLDC